MSLSAEEMFSLTGRTVVMTGGSGFLGPTMVETLVANGARVWLLGRPARTDAVASDLRDRYGKDRIGLGHVDLYDAAAMRDALDEAVTSWGAPDVVVNNAHELGPSTGFNVPEGWLERTTDDHWLRNLSGGVLWPATAMQVLGPHMVAAGRGSIVNVASMYGLVAPNPALYEGTRFVNPPGYSAAKAAMLALTRYAASFWGGSGVRVNALVPGPFSNTRGGSENAVGVADPFLERLRARTLLGRVGSPEDLAGALLFLASDASSFVTGHALVVDGGWTVT